MESLTITAVIIAVTRQIKESFPQVNGLITMLVAMAIGGIAGYFHVEGIDIYQGIVLGLAATGTYHLFSRIGRNGG